MPSSEPSTLDGYLLNARSDPPDVRDWPYEPALIQLESRIDPPSELHILNQESEGSCTGFGLAAVINHLNQRRGNPVRVSARMLYEMACRYDEWEGEDGSGSSCRGAIKGWHNMGVCDETLWPYELDRPGGLSLDAAKNARKTTIGAYYRLAQRVSDFHCALNEAHVIYASASIHDGWRSDEVRDGLIPLRTQSLGGHAFAIVGYDDRGFWVQNSWGRGWGRAGLALWSYEDWLRNIRDAWVLQLALPTPQIWHLPPPASAGTERAQFRGSPARAEIAGHFVHIDDGRFQERGKYWSTADDSRVTAELLAQSEKYGHLLFYAHGGLNSPEACARRIAAMKEVFKDNGIYPYHFMYDTGIMEELRDVVLRKEAQSLDRAGVASDASDWLVEKLTRVPGRALWREMKRGAGSPFLKEGAGTEVSRIFIGALRRRPGASRFKVHALGHSTGAILLAHLLGRLAELEGAPRISTLTLMAPASTEDLFEQRYLPLLEASANGFGIDAMQVFNLSERLEQKDSVGKLYRKSLLYLVSRAFEESPPAPILGMQRYSARIPANERLRFIYSEGPAGRESRSQCDTHEGFDNDIASMNHLLRTVLGREPTRPFTKESLDY